MREIKFRAWDKKYKRMEYFDSHKIGIRYYCGEFEVSSSWDDYDLPTFTEDTSDRYILMQYTGLKDKYDNDIYEGDRLLWDNKTDEPDEDIPPVEFNNGCFMCGHDCLCELDLDSMIVISSIHENPELLGQSNE